MALCSNTPPCAFSAVRLSARSFPHFRQGTKVNSKAKGVTAPALAPAHDTKKGGEASAKGLPGASGQAPTATTATGGGAPSGESPSDASAVETSVAPLAAAAAAPAAAPAAGRSEADGDAGGVNSLCAAVKQAWTDEAAGAEEGGRGGEGEREEESDNGGSSGGEGEGAALEEDAGGRSSEDCGDDDAEDVGDDDEWEPEGSSNADEESSAGGAITRITPASALFSADDFPTLGGGGSTPAASAPAPAPAPTPAPTSSPAAAPVPAAAPAAEEPTSSWSLMARSNPAPFKVPVKADPAPLPAATAAAAAAAAASPAADSAGHFSSSGATAASGTAPSRPRPDGAKAGTSRILSTAAAFGVTGGGAENDDGEGWVNPSNIKSQKAAGIGLGGPSQSQTKGGQAAVASKCRAGCVTTDFAMQNVLLQVGLPLLSLDGMAVRRVKQWILRCAACFKTCTEMGRLFCPVCGNASLDRVSCSVNAKTGATYVHLRKNHKVNLRGSKFSIPAPNPSKGRFEGDLLLREDQLLSGIWAQKVYEVYRQYCQTTVYLYVHL